MNAPKHKPTGLYTCEICKGATTKRWVKGVLTVVHQGNTTRRS